MGSLAYSSRRLVLVYVISFIIRLYLLLLSDIKTSDMHYAKVQSMDPNIPYMWWRQRAALK